MNLHLRLCCSTSFIAWSLAVFSHATYAQDAPAGASAPAPSLDRSALNDIMRDQLDPYQPRKLQSLLLRADVQADLDISRETYGLMRAATAELQEKQMELSRGLRDINPADREAMRAHFEKYRTLQKERDQAQSEALNEIFPPEKYARLKQIALQIQIAEAGLSNVLLHGVLGEELALTEEQHADLLEVAQQYEEEKQAKLRKIIAEYDQKLLGHLTPKQRKIVEKQIGEKFEYEAVSNEKQNFQNLLRLERRPPLSSAPQ